MITSIPKTHALWKFEDLFTVHPRHHADHIFGHSTTEVPPGSVTPASRASVDVYSTVIGLLVPSLISGIRPPSPERPDTLIFVYGPGIGVLTAAIISLVSSGPTNNGGVRSIGALLCSLFHGSSS